MSSRLAAAQALAKLLSTIQNPNTSQPLYGITKIGAFYDPTGFNTWAEITHFRGKGGPAGSGGPAVGWRIEETVRYFIGSGFGPYEADSTAAETNKLNTQDILLPTLRQHFQLPQANAITQAVPGVFSVLVEDDDVSRPPARFPNGSIYALWYVSVSIKMQYGVQLVQP